MFSKEKIVCRRFFEENLSLLNSEYPMDIDNYNFKASDCLFEFFLVYYIMLCWQFIFSIYKSDITIEHDAVGLAVLFYEDQIV